jgi:pSer/pThr/pTyr-binding forkhead associated (FHA) protein
MSGFGLDPVPGMDPVATVAATEQGAFQRVGLRLVNGPMSGMLLNPNQPVTIVGRNDPPAVLVDIDLTDAELGSPPMLSRRHAQLEREANTGKLYLLDLGSTNGTFIDGVRLVSGAKSRALEVPMKVVLANLESETVYVDD